MYQDTQRQWRWRYVAKNGLTIAVSSEGYVHKTDCRHAISLMQSSGSDPVIDQP